MYLMSAPEHREVAAHELLERDDQLRALREALGKTIGANGRLVLVAGEAGVGKTALLRSFCESPNPHGCCGARAIRCSRPARWVR